MSKPARRIQLSEDDRQAVEQWLRSRPTPKREVERARTLVTAPGAIS